MCADATFLISYSARALEPRYEKQCVGMLERAAEVYEAIAADGPDTPAGKEAKKRIEALEPKLGV
jgi:hypothetical protein